MAISRKSAVKTLGLAVLGLGGTSLLTACSLFSGGNEQMPIMEDVQWAVNGIDGQDLVEGSVVTVLFSPNGRVSGKASCNGYSGEFDRQEQRLAVTKLVRTKRLCRPASLMEQEQRFTALLQDVEAWEIDDQGRLRLQTADGQSLTATRDK